MPNEDQPDNVVELPAPAPPAEPPPLVLDPAKYGQVIDLSIRRSYGTDCHHRVGSEVDLQARRVICKACGRDLDPFDVLHEIALHWEQRHRQWLDLCADIKAAQQRLESLRRDEANTRARLKRLGLSPPRSRKGIDLSR